MACFWRLMVIVFWGAATFGCADDGSQNSWPQSSWPQWRGPSGDNHAAPGATAPVTWDASTSIAWRTPLPGRGHSSPTVMGDRIYLTTCDEKAAVQMLLVLDRASGKLLRQTPVHEGRLPEKIHGNNTHASPTVACDGKQVYALFNNDYAACVTAFDLEGKPIWQRRVAAFDPQQFQFGFGSSPILVKDLLVVSTEFDGPDSGLYGVDTSDGHLVWKAPRPQSLSYSTPIEANLNGRSQLIMSGNYKIVSYDPRTGQELWSNEATTRATCGTMIWDSNLGLAFASGGYPDNFTLAIRASGEHDVVWQNTTKCYEQSMLAIKGYIYAVADNGVAHCYRAYDGEEMWKERLQGPVSSSPLYVGNNIYVTNERGTTFVFAASPESYQAIAENQLGDEVFATPTPCDGRLYHRYAIGKNEERQEYLVAIEE